MILTIRPDHRYDCKGKSECPKSNHKKINFYSLYEFLPIPPNHEIFRAEKPFSSFLQKLSNTWVHENVKNHTGKSLTYTQDGIIKTSWMSNKR